MANWNLADKYEFTPYTKSLLEHSRARNNRGMYTPPLTQRESAERMPNYEKLTWGEQKVMEALPAVSESVEWAKGKLEGSWLGRQAVWAGSWAGKALNVLDVGAEVVERGLGLATQLSANFDDDQSNDLYLQDLGDAWYAGSLFADTSNLPTFTGKNEDGSWQGVRWPMEMPGAAGLIDARYRIKELTAQGMSRGEALVNARAEYYDSIGALSLRAQLYDSYLHILADPINFIAPYLSPIDFLHTRRIAALTTKSAETLQDLGKLDKFVISLTGGTIQSPSWLGKIADTPGVGVLAKPFVLNDASRAYEYLNIVSDNVGNYILSKFDDPVQIIDVMRRAAKGSVGPEFGHAWTTLEGRTVQGVLGATEAKAGQLLDTYKAISPHRQFLDDAAGALGISKDKIVGELAEEATRSAMLRRLADAGLEVDSSIIKQISDFGDAVPYTEDLFKLYLRNMITDTAAQQAIVQFGVKSRGLVLKVSHTLKAAETMAFLRLNPGFAVKNFVNNELTMIARGVAGNVKASQIEDLKNILGFEPHRMAQAFTMAGEEGLSGAQKLGRGEQLISDALRGERGTLDKLSKWLNEAQIGPEVGGKRIFDMGFWSSKMEQSASQRAFYKGYLDGWSRFWKAGDGYDLFRNTMKPQFIDAIGDDVVTAVEDAIAGAVKEKDLDDLLASNDFGRSSKGIMNSVARNLDTDLKNVFDADEIFKIEQGLAEAMKQGPTAIRSKMESFRDDFVTRIEEAHNVNRANRVEEVAAAVQTGGPSGLLLKWGDAVDELSAAHLSDNLRMSQVLKPGGGVADWYWESVFKSREGFWDRTWNHFDEMIEGVEKGAKNMTDELGNPTPWKTPSNVKTGYKRIRSETQKFFTARNKRWREFYAALRKGDTPKFTFEEIRKLNDDAFMEVTRLENNVRRDMDDIVTDFVRQKDPELADLYSSWRAKSRELTMKHRAENGEFMRTIYDAPASQQPALYAQFYRDRYNRLVEMWQEERRGIAMLGGSESAAQSFRGFDPGMQPRTQGHAQQVRSFARDYGLLDEAGELKSYQLRSIVNKYLDGKYGGTPPPSYTKVGNDFVRDEITAKFDKIEDVPLSMLQQALDARVAYYKKVPKFGATEAKDLERGLDILALGRDGVVDGMLDNTSRKYIQQYIDIYGNNAQKKRVTELVGDRWLADDLQEYVIREELADIFEDVIDRISAKERAARVIEPPTGVSISDPRFATKQAAAVNPPDWALDQLMMQRGWTVLDEVENEAVRRFESPPLKWEELPADQAAEIQRYIQKVKGQMADARYASIRYGMYKRDSALLNYNRRYNYNTWLGALAPFEFWTTQSIMKWAIHSIDRPAMLSTYLRMKKFITQAGAPNQGFPSRLKNSIRLPAPFMPEWMGNTGLYIDPLRFALPFDAFAAPWERANQDQHTLEYQVERYIQDMISDGAVDSQAGMEAISTHQGEVWEQYKAIVAQKSDNGQSDAYDFVNMFTSVHAPLDWAYKGLVKGEPETIGPLAPIRTSIRRVQGMLGVGPADPSKGTWGNIRQTLGLPAYDQWDNYRIERMVANMVATQQITPDQGMRAMIEQEGEIWDMAAEQSAREFAGGSVGGFIFKTLGIPTQSYPEGELIQRSLQDDFSNAYEAYEKGDPTALTKFFDDNPEYESRLALWKKPEERMQRYLVDEIWSKYHDMPTVHKNQLKDSFGDMWQMLFLNKETRSEESVPTETLQVWLKLMGGDPPGTLSGPAVPIDFAPRDEAWRVEQFYDLRRQMFDNYYDQQSEYFMLAEGNARRSYLRQHPELKQYWNWRNDYLHRNPDVAPYVTDDYEFDYGSVEEMQSAVQGQPSLSYYEWTQLLGQSTTNVLLSRQVPADARDYLEEYAAQLGMTLEQLIDSVANSRR